MPRRITTAAVTLFLSAVAMAQGTATPEASRSLNLSLPSDAHWSSTVRQDRPTPDGPRASPIGLPDIGGRSTTGQSGRMPYGTGYEARQRNNATNASGSGTEMGRGHGGGGRMGRGR
jgi:hypothetical protein